MLIQGRRSANSGIGHFSKSFEGRLGNFLKLKYWCIQILLTQMDSIENEKNEHVKGLFPQSTHFFGDCGTSEKEKLRVTVFNFLHHYQLN